MMRIKFELSGQGDPISEEDSAFKSQSGLFRVHEAKAKETLKEEKAKQFGVDEKEKDEEDLGGLEEIGVQQGPIDWTAVALEPTIDRHKGGRRESG
jgi:hypothetical protein